MKTNCSLSTTLWLSQTIREVRSLPVNRVKPFVKRLASQPSSGRLILRWTSTSSSSLGYLVTHCPVMSNNSSLQLSHRNWIITSCPWMRFARQPRRVATTTTMEMKTHLMAIFPERVWLAQLCFATMSSQWSVRPKPALGKVSKQSTVVGLLPQCRFHSNGTLTLSVNKSHSMMAPVSRIISQLRMT
jgi:hypothetical protein